jgi:hypothetical protein
MNENELKNYSKTDWERIDQMDDEDIDTTDIPPLTDDFFETGEWRLPGKTIQLTVEVEPEVAEWYRKQGRNSGLCMSAALRIYAQAHESIAHKNTV